MEEKVKELYEHLNHNLMPSVPTNCSGNNFSGDFEQCSLTRDVSTFASSSTYFEENLPVLYLKVTNDEYELPEAVADSAKELAELCGVAARTIHDCIRKVQLGTIKRSQYIRVFLTKEEEE